MFPSNMADHPAIPIIKKLLDRTPYQRGTPSDLKKHEWFKNMNWEDLYYRAVQPSYVPLVEPMEGETPMIGTVQEIILNDELLEPIRGKHKSPIKGWDANF